MGLAGCFKAIFATCAQEAVRSGDDAGSPSRAIYWRPLIA
jgi:hypothetical protein